MSSSEIIKRMESNNIIEITKTKQIPKIKVGNTVSVSYFVDEKMKKTFNGIVIAINNAGINTSIKVMQLNSEQNERFEYIFPIYSPKNTIKIISNNENKFRRSKLFYLRHTRSIKI